MVLLILQDTTLQHRNYCCSQRPTYYGDTIISLSCTINGNTTTINSSTVGGVTGYYLPVNTSGNATITVNWQGYHTTAPSDTSSTKTFSMYGSKSEIYVDFRNANISSICNYYIATDVTKITFIGTTSRNVLNKKICVNGSRSQLYMNFYSMRFTGQNNSPAIDSTGCNTLNLYCDGNNYLYGGAVTNSSSRPANCAVIMSGVLSLTGYDLLIYGGNASTPSTDGGNGISAIIDSNIATLTVIGGNGSDGNNAADMLTVPAKASYGNDGVSGTDNENAGSIGGKGGVAIYGIVSQHAGSVGLIGGNGGDGGDGGNGGIGGEGGDAKLFVYGGDGGDGGIGSNGGRGGAGGTAISNAYFTDGGTYIIFGGIGGDGGDGGNGGSGGEGGASKGIWRGGAGGCGGSAGHGGAAGSAGTAGTSYGSAGTAGNSGTIGTAGSNGVSHN